jgi:hypothetical protein
MGRGDGDEDSVSLIDLKSEPYRTVGIVRGPQWTGADEILPRRPLLGDRRAERSTKPSSHPFHHDKGALGA